MKKQNLLSLCLTLSLGLAAVAPLVTGCKGDRYSRSTGQYIDDQTLTVRVSSALHGNQEYKFGSVDVKAFRGNVQLSGFVNSEEQKERAGDIARTVEGVRAIENNITVKSSLSQNP